MRFLLYQVDGDAPSAPPSPQLIAEAGKFTEETKRAGVLLATGGLAASSTRVRTAGGKVTVTDGPFTETKELTGGWGPGGVEGGGGAVGWGERVRRGGGGGGSVGPQAFLA